MGNTKTVCHNENIRDTTDDMCDLIRFLPYIWPDSTTPSQTQMAYAISVCQRLLNPNNKHIKITKKSNKEKIGDKAKFT